MLWSAAELSLVQCIEGLVLGSYLSTFCRGCWVFACWFLVFLVPDPHSWVRIFNFFLAGLWYSPICSLRPLCFIVCCSWECSELTQAPLPVHEIICLTVLPHSPRVRDQWQFLRGNAKHSNFLSAVASSPFFLPLFYQRWFASADILPPSASQP